MKRLRPVAIQVQIEVNGLTLDLETREQKVDKVMRQHINKTTKGQWTEATYYLMSTPGHPSGKLFNVQGK